jgi:hypothetical protein
VRERERERERRERQRAREREREEGTLTFAAAPVLCKSSISSFPVALSYTYTPGFTVLCFVSSFDAGARSN